MKGHSYKSFKSHWLWTIIDESIATLVDNQDIEEKTSREYIVGYLCKSIMENDNFSEIK